MHRPMMETSKGVSSLTDFDAIGLFDHLPGMAYRCQWDGDWTMEFVSQGSHALTGYLPEDLIENRGVSWSRLIHPDDLGQVSRDLRSALKHGAAFQIIYRLSMSEGTEKWVIENGHRVSLPAEYPTYLEGFIRDITNEKLQASDFKEWQNTVENVPVVWVMIDEGGKIREWNQQAESIFGWKRDEVVGQSLVETIIPAESSAKHRDEVQHLSELQVNQVFSQNFGLTAHHKTGREFPIELTISARRMAGSSQFNVFMHDISERKESEKSLEEANQTISRLMRKDALTGLANRKSLEEDMLRALPFARRWHQPLTLVMADVDRLKELNDEHGYLAGDQVLVSFADLLTGSCRAEDFVARCSEGFVLLLPNTDLPQAAILAERLREKTEKSGVLGISSVTASFGITKFVPEDTNESLFARAQKALNRAKDAGENRIESLEWHLDPVQEVPLVGC